MRASIREIEMKAMSFEDYVRTFNLTPLVSIKRSCQIANMGVTKLYDLVGKGEISIVKDGRRSNIPAQQLYDRYRRLIEASGSWTDSRPELRV
jgi:hypothetical protein